MATNQNISRPSASGHVLLCFLFKNIINLEVKAYYKILLQR